MKLIYILIIAIIGYGCTTTRSEDSNGHSHADEANSEDLIVLEKQQIEKIGLKSGLIEHKNLNDNLNLGGYLELLPQHKLTVSSLISGRITGVSVIPTQYVNKGDVLMYLETPELIEIQRDYLEHLNELRYLQAEYERQKRLFEEKHIAEKEFQITESEFLIARANLAARKKEIELFGIDPVKVESGTIASRIPIRSMIGGFTGNEIVNNGTWVDPEDVLLTVSDISRIHAELVVFEKDIHHLQLEQPVRLWLAGDRNRIFNGRIFMIGRELDLETRSIVIHAEVIEEDPLLIPGSYVEGLLALSNQKVPCLPEQAVIDDQGLSYIFCVEKSNDLTTSFRKIPVTTGVRELGYVEINPLEEMADDVKIVIEGSFFLNAVTVETADHH